MLTRRPGLRAKLQTVSTPPSMRPSQKPPKRRSPKVEDIERRIAEAYASCNGDGWRLVPLEKAGPLLVGLWAKLHEDIYGIGVAEALAMGDEWIRAVVAAKRAAAILGDVGDAIEFVTWTWREEQRRERRRREHGDELNWRLSWQNLFLRSGTLLDYKHFAARRSE